MTRPARSTLTSPDIAAILQSAAEEAARLLEADGALIYLLDADAGVLRFAHDSGMADARRRRWVRQLQLQVGQGMFGVSVAERRVVVTDDYQADQSFPHGPATDRFAREFDLRSMVVAPLVAGDRVFGGLGTFSNRTAAFTPAHIALVRALADHAAAAMSNALLIEQLASSRAEIALGADAERALREIATRISAIHEPRDVIQQTVDEAARLLNADGARIDLIDPKIRLLRWAYQSGDDRPSDDIWPEDPEETLDQGVSGKAVTEGRVFFTGDYLTDERFDHGMGADTYIANVGVRSVMAAPLVGDAGPFGALTVYTTRVDAWTADDAEILGDLGTAAAISLTNARLIAEIRTSREALERRAEAEKALREIAARITAIREPSELLQHVVDEATRLVRADGTVLDLVDSVTGRLYWAYDSGLSDRLPADVVSDLWLPIGVGATGKAVAEDRVIVAGDDLAALFPPSPVSDRFFATTGFRSLIAAPITGEAGPLGALEVYSTRAQAFDPTDAGVIRSLADQAAIAIHNARLIDELARSRSEIVRRADSERRLREIAATISALTNLDEILQVVIDGAKELLNATGGMIDLVEDTGRRTFADAADPTGTIVMTALDDVELRTDAGVSGLAMSSGQVQWSGDYLADTRFLHTPERDEFIVDNDLHSVIAAPLWLGARAVGAVTIYDGRPDAFGEADALLLRAIADQAAVSIANAQLIIELRRAREEVERRADVERSLRQIAKAITAIREPDEILQQTVDEARRLLRSTDVRIDVLHGDRLRWAFTSSRREVKRRMPIDAEFAVGEGAAGRAVQERRLVRIADYLADDSFVHTAASDQLVRETGMRSVLAVPLLVEGEPLGAISAASQDVDAYDDADAELLQALADQAAIAIQNARLIEALEVSRTDLARRAETERSLREMAARIAELRDPDELLRRIVDDAIRLLGSDGAHMTRMSDDGTYLVPLVVAGGLDEATEAWLKNLKFPLMGGINGLAAGLAQPIWTEDYRTDDRIPHERGDNVAAKRLGLRGMASVPLRAPEGTIMGTLAVSYRVPHAFDDDELAVLKSLADHAAIAITNTSLLERLSESEERYRHLVQNSPDLVWSIDADARFTFVSDTCERLTGWHPDELLGKHFGALVHESSRDVAEVDWTLGMNDGNQELRGRLNLLHKDGHPIPAEFSAMSELDAEGRFIGANGAVRDMTERDRLERELRESEERYRFLVQNSPDVVFQIDDQGRFAYLGETIERMTGFAPTELLGQHFSTIVDSGSHAEAGARWAALVADPATPQTVQLNLRHKDGSTVPVEVSAIGLLDERGRFDGIHGATRDVTERESLARNLREQAAALAAGEERAHLARELHDSVTQALFSMTLLTRTTEIQLDRDPAAARDNLGTLRDLQREALAEMRALIFELRPGNLEQDGLNRALKTHTAALSGRIGLPIVVTSDLEARLPIQIEEVLYRIAQEALHNVVKHAGARQARVELEGEPERVVLRIVDDGQGFDPADIPEGHLGLTGMRARAAKIDGQLSITSRPGAGTTIELSVPVQREASSDGDGTNGATAANGRQAASSAGAAHTEPIEEASPASAE